jgi:phage terminase Nu1 subunit (DNA packaging protein)
MMKPTPKTRVEGELRGWASIAQFLSMPQSTVHRWAKDGMPVRRSGRTVTAARDELDQWLQRSAGESVGVQVARPDLDLLKSLRASVAAQKDSHPSPPTRAQTQRIPPKKGKKHTRRQAPRRQVS